MEEDYDDDNRRDKYCCVSVLSNMCCDVMFYHTHTERDIHVQYYYNSYVYVLRY